MVIAIDFDGTLHDIDNPVPGRKMGPPMPGAVEAVKRLAQHHDIVIFTVRGDQPYIHDWLAYWGFPKPAAITNVKNGAFHWIIDDRGIRYHGGRNSWEDIADEFEDGVWA